jgi:hemerythrin-like domain-containing protein
MKLLDVLVDEHRGFGAMLEVLERAAARVRDRRGVPADMLCGLLDFFEHFTDGHHTQEEEILFPVLAQHGIGRDQTVVAALLAQHEAGRAYTRKMRAALEGLAAGDANAGDAFAAHAGGYTELIREHIRIEDSYFYGVATEILTHAEQESISEAFSRATTHRVPDAERGRYLTMLREYPAVAAGWAAEPGGPA